MELDLQRRINQIIEQENPEVVGLLLLSLARENEALKKEKAKREAEDAEREQTMMAIEEQLKIARRFFYGKKSEIREASDRPRDKSQEEAQLFSQAAFPTDEKKGEKNTESLQAKIIEHHISDEELIEESSMRGIENPSADQWEDTGLFDSCTKIQIIERRYEKELHKKFKKRLKPQYNTSDKEVLVTAAGPDGLLSGMNYTTEFVASVVADKFISHMPLERQTRQMESLGLKGMKTSTLSRLCALAAGSLEPVQAKILSELKRSDLALHLDETPWRIQNPKQRDGYMWIISNRYGSYYFFKPTRSGEVIKSELNGYSGPVVSDGFSGYNALNETDIKQAFCWAHARREFLKIEEFDPTVKPVLDDIDKLFEIERRAKTFDELTELRKVESKSVVHRIEQYLIEEHPRSRPSSQKRKAIEYLQKRIDGFKVFLDDTRVPLSNNEAERTIRHAVVGRKNYYGSGNHPGAETAATLFTIVETCKKNDLDPRTYILMVLQSLARGENPPTPLEYARQLRQ